MTNAISIAEPDSTEPTISNDGEQEDSAPQGRRIFTSYLFRTNTGSGVMFSEDPPPPPPEPVRRTARVARMLALAHRLQRAIDNGEYENRAELSRRFGITRARVTQLLNLTILAPDIQENVLNLESVDGLEPTSERALRKVSSPVEWENQRKRWENLNIPFQLSCSAS